MTRKLALLLAGCCLGFWHVSAWALGLGDIAVESSLNQRFQARIELRNTEGLAPTEIIANLGSADDFKRVGVERFFYLSDLQFKTDLTDPAHPAIVVTSSQPITEPFVDFVVEVLWPSGRLLREYTVLLDPPTYAARPTTAPSAPTTATMTPPSGSPTASRPTTVTTEPAGGTAGQGEFVGGTYGVTDRNDTLWEIALKVRPDASLSAQQTMLALLRMNPDAFIGNNINQLKAGYVLRVPDASEIRRLSFDDAVVQVSEQNDRWRKGLDRAPLDARPATASAGSGSASGGELRLVAADDGSAAGSADAAGSGGGGAAGGGGADPAALAAAQAKASDLSAQLQASQARADELAHQLELKNEQLARAQEVLKQQLAQPAQPAQPAAPAARSGADQADGLFGLSWMLLGGIVGGLVVLAGVVLVVLRRLGGGSSNDEEMDEAVDVEADVEKTQLMPALSAADIAAATGSDAPASGSDEADDAIGEADVYMVYGRFSEAARVLNAAIDADPQRADIRLKLLEVYVESGDADGFNAQSQALSAFADAETVALADQLAARLPGAMSSNGDVTEGSVEPAASREAAEGEVSLDFDLAAGGDDEPADLDSLDIDLDMGDEAPAAASADAAADGDLDLDFDLDMGPADSEEPADDDLGLSIDGDDEAPAADGDLGDLDFDLEVSGDEPAAPAAESPELSLDEEAGAEAESADDGGIDFDFDLGGGDDDRSEAPAAATPTGNDDFEIDDLAEPGSGEEADDGISFEIDELAEPAAESSSDLNAALGLDDNDDDDLTMLDTGDGEADEDDATQLRTPDDGNELDFDLDDDDFDFGGGDADEISTKLELARAYVDMGDEDGAREILDEVVRDGDDNQKREAGELLQQLG